ncbi:hypothetical protein B566_EDAN018301 [Ephemera danica]|nr:hypothetical protein B566_EDAN018301 [Ephemera danica]
MNNYVATEHVTIDEMLVKFRGNCPFRQYIPSKPGKYGIKIHALCDAVLPYTIKMEIYAGTQPDGPYKISNSPLDVVPRLIQPISGTGRNLTVDNWYTSYTLLQNLLAQHKLTLVGTVRKNKREIPPELVNAKGRQEKSSFFGYQKDVVLVSYVPKKNKCVLLISSMHNEGKISAASGASRKPEIIMLYNETKGGVDLIDKMNGTYSVARGTRRWTLTIIYHIINVAALNAYVMYSCTKTEKIVRRFFLRELALSLIKPYVESRAEIPSLSKSLAEKVKKQAGVGANNGDEIGEPPAARKTASMASSRITLAQRGRIRQFLEEDSSDEELNEDSSSGEEDHVSENDHHTDSETFMSRDSSDESDNEDDDFFWAKDKLTKWMKNPVKSTGRRRAHNILTEQNSLKGPALQATTPLDFFLCMITEEMVEKIVQYTNIKIRTIAANYARDSAARDTNKNEILAVFGLLILTGIYRGSHINLEDFWATDGSGIEVFRATMSLHRFKFLLRALRFDDIRDRQERRETDKLAPVRELFDMFNANCVNKYVATEHVTIDEMLVKFRGNCPFRQYIPSKPGKYGIKVHALCDAVLPYTIKMEIYAGTQPDGPYKMSNSPLDVVPRLIEPISGTGRNLTIDNWYTSYTLLQRLLSQHKLTVVGTLRKNKREVPPEFVNVKGRDEKSSLFGYQKDIVLVSYVPKKNKCVLLISSMHNEGKISAASGSNKKPEIIMQYNETKGGVDLIDKMNGTYSVARGTRRWTLTLIYHLINVAALNAYVMYSCTKTENVVRRVFLRELALSLIKPYVETRAAIPNLSKSLAGMVKKYAGIADNGGNEIGEPPAARKTARCKRCPRAKDSKTNVQCKLCKSHVCNTHRVTLCLECFENPQNYDSSNESNA